MLYPASALKELPQGCTLSTVAILTGLRSITSLLVYDVVELEQLRTPSETRPLLYCD
jgi:hypothetical protein